MNSSRRDVKSRGKQIFHSLSRFLIKIGLTPNHVSVASSFFALFGAYGFYKLSAGQFWIGVLYSLIGIQLRLVCNLIDGLMAVEGKLSTPQGELYNDLPDRFSDCFLITSCGFIIGPMMYGWIIIFISVFFALMTAYVRLLGASQGIGHDFGGPMAKQHRMAVLNISIIGLCIERLLLSGESFSLYIGLIVIGAGSFLTMIVRLKRISSKLAVR